MPKPVTEGKLTEASKPDSNGRIQVQVLTPGWGSSGYYSPKVVESAASLVKAGLPMYVDHATEGERLERPGRSVKDIGAKFVTEAKWDGTALVAEAELVPGPYREALVALQDVIGVSINGSASDIIEGEAEGRSGRIIEGLADITSVDFVTRAGRGGRFTALLESALLEESVLTVTEATASDRMGHLREVVRTTHGGDQKSAWVRDQDAEKSTVWFDVHDHRSDGGSKTFEQGYAVGTNDVDVALTGQPVEVRPVTKYVPVTRPDSNNPTTEADQEVTMGNIQIEEAEHKRLNEKAGRVDVLESENTTLKAENKDLKESAARSDRVARARVLISESSHTFDKLQTRGLLVGLPVKEGVLDEEKFKTLLTEAVAEAAAAAGSGTVSGFGGTTVAEGTVPTWDDIDNLVKEG